MRLRAPLLSLLLACGGIGVGCGGDSSVGAPPLVSLPVVYVSQLPAGCPESGSICYAGCAHHNAPAGLQAIVPLWGAPTLRLTETSPGRYEGVLADIPTGVTLQLIGRDIGMCCVDACNYPPVLAGISLGGTQLTHVVHSGLPEGLTGALEFRVDAGGVVRP